MSSEDALHSSAPLLADRYRLIECIGHGGMGVVWRSFDLDLEEEVAIKFLHDDVTHDPELRAHLRREVRLSRRVTHPNVARVHEFGHDAEVHFLTMELVPGETLRSLLAREAPLPRERGQALVRGLLAGLSAAHEAGVVHGDLKPANVLVNPERGAVLTDFGIARSLSEVHQSGASFGTPIYMAPELFVGAPVSLRSDVYAAGVLTFELLTGRLPWSDEECANLFALKFEAQAPDLAALAPDLPPTWLSVLSECLRNEPGERPADAQELLRRLAIPARAVSGAVRRAPTRRPAHDDSGEWSRPSPELLRYGPLDFNTVCLYLQARDAYMAISPDAMPLHAAAWARAPEHPILRLGYWMAKVRAQIVGPPPSPALLAELRREAEAAIAEFGDLGDPYLAMASILFVANEPAACARFSEEALARDPGLAPARVFRAKLMIALGRLGDAEREVELGLSASRNNTLLWQARGEILARRREWDEFYALYEGELSARRLRGPLVVKNMFPQPRQDVLGRLVEARAEDCAAPPPPGELEGRAMATFLLRQEERRGVFERLNVQYSAVRRSMISVEYAKILCEMACVAGDPGSAEHQLVRLDEHGLADIHWLDNNPMLAPLRDGRRFSELRDRAQGRAHGLGAAL